MERERKGIVAPTVYQPRKAKLEGDVSTKRYARSARMGCPS